MDDLVIVKLKPDGMEAWRYSGRTLVRDETRVVIEAFFNRDDFLFFGMMLGRGDRFIETYYSDRWYNTFEIRDRADDRLKGWYCNITRPANIQDGQIAYVDLALDLLVFADGRQVVLDEDEFEALNLPGEEKAQALSALGELQDYFTKHLSA